MSAFLLLPGDSCRLSDYRRLKSKVLDVYDKRHMVTKVAREAREDNMAARKQLVDAMFRGFDADNNGQISTGELSQVNGKMITHLEFKLLIFVP